MSVVKNLKLSLKLQLLAENYPTTKKIAKTFGLITVGEATSQYLIDKRSTWDHKRTFRQAFVGSCLIFPMNLFYISKIAPLIGLRLAGMGNVFNPQTQTFI